MAFRPPLEMPGRMVAACGRTNCLSHSQKHRRKTVLRRGPIRGTPFMIFRNFQLFLHSAKCKKRLGPKTKVFADTLHQICCCSKTELGKRTQRHLTLTCPLLCERTRLSGVHLEHSTGDWRQEDCCEFDASLGYMMKTSLV